MSCISNTRHILKRDGTNQYERLPDALRPAFVNVDERTREDMLQIIREFSKQVQYYNETKSRDGDWEAFFEDFTRTHEPHIALLMAFLEIYNNARDHINEITGHHLEYYYKRILQISQKPAEPDKVHLVFELAKNVDQCKLGKSTLFKAGKDDTGKELYYESDREIALNKASIDSLKTIYADKNLDYRIYAAEVANSADGAGEKFEGNEPKWYTFGRSQSGLSAAERDMDDTEIGFAVASSLLELSEGQRNITLEIKFNIPSTGNAQTINEILSKDYSRAFRAYLSGQKSWLGPFEVKVVKTTDNKGLQLNIELGPEQDGVVGYDASVLDGSYDATQPLMKILLDPAAEPYPYQSLMQLRIRTVRINVNVEGVSGLIIQNENGVLDPGKPFQPFGSSPVTGSVFYIGNAEVFNKKLDSLELCYKWKGLPQNYWGFDYYYNGYSGNYATDAYACQVAALIDKQWTPASGRESIKLFELDSVSTPVQSAENTRIKNKKLVKKRRSGQDNLIRMDYSSPGNYSAPAYGAVFILKVLKTAEIKRQVNVGLLKLIHQAEKQELTQLDNSVRSGFLRLELTSRDFGHREYPSALTRQAMALSKFVADHGTTVGGPALPNPPYTPVMEYLKINYSSSIQLDLSKSETDESVQGLFHAEPFGQKLVYPADGAIELSFLPQYADEGSLFIGIKDLKPPQTLSILFQVAEDSGSPDISSDSLSIIWEYLSQDSWIGFSSSQIVSDSTNGLLNSGIIIFDIPGEAGSENTIMPGGLHWIRARAFQNVAGMNQMIAITAQAVKVIFKDQGNDPGHLAQALEAGSVSKPAIPNPSLKKITQPYASFGGKMAENSESFYEPFYTRISERLRHKNRAITVWDLERMVLQEFPGIYKVKGLSHSSDKTDIAPGNITMVVIENVRNRNAVNPLQPRTSLSTLAAIKKFLGKYTSPFVNLFIQNPIYEEILVDFKVRFHPGYDAGYYKSQLNEEIKKFLSPWAYVEGEDIVFGNIIYKSSILNFVEEREYVDYVTDFRMYHIMESWGIGCMEVNDDFVVGDQDKTVDVDQAEGKTSRSILVSAADHQIYVLSQNEYTCEGNAG